MVIVDIFSQYLGCVPAVEAQGQGVTDEAVKRLLEEAKVTDTSYTSV